MRYVAHGLVGVSPLEMGSDGGVPEEHFKIFVSPVGTYICILQNNTANQLTKHINTTMNRFIKGPCLFQRLRHESAIDFKDGVSNPIEKQRLRWITFHNLNMWHENWERCLIELGFTTKFNLSIWERNNCGGQCPKRTYPKFG